MASYFEEVKSALEMAMAFSRHRKSNSKLTGGPWGTLDQAEACLAPRTTKLASRAAAERLATRRVESIVCDNEVGKSDGMESEKGNPKK